MKKDKKNNLRRKSEIPTDTALNPEMTVRIDGELINYNSEYAGDSVDEHKNVEKTNRHFADEEINQQNNL